jgi:hypothetical protein
LAGARDETEKEPTEKREREKDREKSYKKRWPANILIGDNLNPR